MSDRNLSEFLEERLSWELAPYEDLNSGRLAEDLADGLKSNGYCEDPYIEYEKALCCPINKRKEKDCRMTSCTSYQFCMTLRKEGYINEH